ncbi:transaldolase [Fodinibius roseus]|uniref:Transaldolase n=1 Tax=Fodinibius roseus TaxID=1194090 RepID=A0A1M5KZR8_9BACT|nr:fructose-6-phosphate aldolase [Fodinibius roseus]SHG58236.1 transaldolase [Fodinibius roseus]
MKLFLDTANIEEIREAKSWGIIDGVTTNPSHVAKEGTKFEDLIDEIFELFPDGEISVEVTATDFDGIVKEAHTIVEAHENALVKVPLIKEGIKAIKVLSEEGIKINTTLCFSAVQAMLAAKAGATYISPFVGRLDAIGTDGIQLVRDIRQIYDNYGMETGILAAALRTPKHVLQSAVIGAEVATMNFEIMEKLFHHPMTDSGLEQFLDDWENRPVK